MYIILAGRRRSRKKRSASVTFFFRIERSLPYGYLIEPNINREI